MNKVLVLTVVTMKHQHIKLYSSHSILAKNPTPLKIRSQGLTAEVWLILTATATTSAPHDSPLCVKSKHGHVSSQTMAFLSKESPKSQAQAKDLVLSQQNCKSNSMKR